MLKNKKGFTLVELLAVIVILAIILAIAVPGITKMTESTKQSAFESNVKMIITNIEYKNLECDVEPTTDGCPVKTEDITTAELDKYGVDPEDYETFTITNLAPVTITLKSKTDSQFGAWQTVGAVTKSSVKVERPE